MGRTILGQVIASTSIDSHGESIPHEELESLFEQVPDPWVISPEHNLSNLPVARGTNKRLERLPGGHLAIKVDIEVLDENEFRAGGFSIAYHRKTIHIGKGEPPLTVSLNPRQFDIDHAIRDLQELVRDNESIAVGERIEKADGVQIAVIVLLVTAALKIVDGFLARVGEGLFETLRNWLRQDAAPSESNKTVIQFNIKTKHKESPLLVVLSVDERVPVADLAQLKLASISEELDAVLVDDVIQRVVGHIEVGPRIRLDWLVTAGGKTVPCTHRWPNTRQFRE